ncbi:zinc finger protein 398-like isoform X2 [Pleurodeles waltl]|uniref:zinc finger protein 398-like isoform X2 n=1 Tax=Pleurodeles waltl TaxID=8319 RepID=UPI0037097F7B
MSGEGPVEEQVKFWDVAACFSEEEWMFLHEWQKDFYKNVMKEIHQALILMGYQILNPETLLRIYRGRDEFRTDHQAAATPAATEPPLAPRPTVLPDVLFRIRREEDLYCEDKPSSLEAGGFPVGPAAFSLQPEENSQLYPDGQEDLEQSHIGHHPPGHIPDVIIVNIKEEDDTCSTDHPDCEIIESTIDPAVGHGIMNIQEKLGESQDRTEETIIDLSEEEKTVAFQSANGEPNCVIQLQPEICHEMHGASSGPYENDFSILKHLNEHQGMAEVRISHYKEQESNLNSLQFFNGMRSGPTKKLSYTCPECSQSYSNRIELIRHMPIHSEAQAELKPYACTDCEKSFFQKSRLVEHYRTHTGEKPYVCTFCRKGFNRKYHLKEHVRIHTGEKPYKCSDCERSFPCKSNLNQHRKRNH